VSPAAAAAASGAATSNAFAGMTFVFTGKMATLERKPAEQLVAPMGGAALDAVNKALTYLVVGDMKKPGEQSSKEKSADKLVKAGSTLKIISETEFLSMVDDAQALAAQTPVGSAPTAPPSEATAPLSEATPPLSEATPPLSGATPPLSGATAPLSEATAAPSKAAAAPLRRLDHAHVAFAGTLASYSLADVTRKVHELGGEVVDAVDAQTTIVVVGAKGKAGDKLNAARKLQASQPALEILSEADFGKRVGLGQIALF
jgi:NAD-dependent DNA ligase